MSNHRLDSLALTASVMRCQDNMDSYNIPKLPNDELYKLMEEHAEELDKLQFSLFQLTKVIHEKLATLLPPVQPEEVGL